MHLWSQLYQGFEPSITIIFRNPPFPEAPDTTFAQFSPLMPHLTKTYSNTEVGEKYKENNQNIVCLNWRLRSANINAWGLKFVGDTDKIYTSQDCITSYIVTALNQLGAGVRTITNAASVGYLFVITSFFTIQQYRSCKSPYISPEAVGNAIYVVSPSSMGSSDISAEEFNRSRAKR